MNSEDAAKVISVAENLAEVHDVDNVAALKSVVNAITHNDEEYIASPEGEEALRKIANAFNQMHAAAEKAKLGFKEVDVDGYADNRAGRRAQAKAQKTKGSKQRRLDKKAAEWVQRKVK